MTVEHWWSDDWQGRAGILRGEFGAGWWQTPLFKIWLLTTMNVNIRPCWKWHYVFGWKTAVFWGNHLCGLQAEESWTFLAWKWRQQTHRKRWYWTVCHPRRPSFGRYRHQSVEFHMNYLVNGLQACLPSADSMEYNMDAGNHTRKSRYDRHKAVVCANIF